MVGLTSRPADNSLPDKNNFFHREFENLKIGERARSMGDKHKAGAPSEEGP